MNKKQGLFLAFAAAFTALVIGRGASALTLVPPTIEFSAQPGQVLKQDIRLYNEGTDPVVVYASTANFGAKDEEGSPDFNFATANEDLASWVEVTKDPITLAPQATEKIPVTINVPANADPGGHYAGIFFGTAPENATGEGGQVKIVSKVGTLIILRIEGDVRESAKVEEFSVVGGKSQSHLPVDFLLRIKNTGNVHFKPKGFVTIRNMFGGVSATIPVNPKEGSVLPDSVRRFEMLWKRDSDSVKATNFFSKIGAEWSNFALGTYTAEAVVTYGQNNQTLTASTRVSVVPWELLTVMLVVLILVIMILVMAVKSYNTMIIRRVQEQTKPKSGKTPPTGSG